MSYRRMAAFKTADEFREYLAANGIHLNFDDSVEIGPAAPLARPLPMAAVTVGNRFAILPMEGWDGTLDGRPTDLTLRRWQRFGQSGAKLIWGGEAVAVRHDGRANPNQLLINPSTVDGLARLRETLVAAHATRFGRTDDLFIGLQLTHSGRYARPNHSQRLEPRIAYRHPILDGRCGIADDAPVLTDSEIRRLIGDFVAAAELAERAGFAFVDIKHCHGYLGHEFLSASTRSGSFGGSFENRTRFLREVVTGLRRTTPRLEIGVRFSAFDFVPFTAGPDRIGKPVLDAAAARCTFGGDGSGLGIDLAEPKQFLDLLVELRVPLACITAGSPYYNPHIQRPAAFPPSDGYLPPEDPLVGVARQIAVTAELKRHRPELVVVGSAYSYLQEWLPHVGQHTIRTGGADFVGLGRMVLAYPELAADTLAGRPLDRKRLCRTFSDCTTAPRNGLVSGCYPLDPHYKQRPEAAVLAEIKQQQRPLQS